MRVKGWFLVRIRDMVFYVTVIKDRELEAMGILIPLATASSYHNGSGSISFVPCDFELKGL